MTRIRIARCFTVFVLLAALGIAPPSARAALPTPNQPILVVQNSASADPYQNFVPELLTTEGLNGFQTAQLPELTAAFLTNYDVVILPHLTLTTAQATLFQNYVNAGGTLVGFRPDLKLANVFGVASLGSTLSEGWLRIDTSTAYGSGLDNTIMKFHGTADLYSLSGASALATLYNNPGSPTVSPAASIYTFGLGKAVLFSFDLTQSIVLMRQGNPAWAGYPNIYDGYRTLRASQMFMDVVSGQFWNDLGDGALNDVPQADIQMRLFSNAVVVANAAKRPLPRFWYFPSQNRALLLMTGDEHGDPVSNSLFEIGTVQQAGGKLTNFLWYPFGSISSSQVNTWLSAGHAMEIHFNDTAEQDGSGIAGSGATWNGMQSVISTALSSFATAYPTAPPPTTTRNHLLIWVSRNAAGNPDQTAQAKLFQAAGIELDVTYSAFPNRWGYMTGSGLPMKFLDTANGTVIPVYEQATQYEDDIQLSNDTYALNWNLATAQTHYEKSLSDSLTKYNTVITMLFHPDHWSSYSSYAQTVLQYAQSHSIPMYTTTAWLQFWKGRTATTLSMPSFSSDTLTFTATGSPAGLTLLVPNASGSNKVVSTFEVDGVPQSFTVSDYQGVRYAAVTLTTGTHNVTVTYTAAASILGQISPSSAAASTTIQLQSSTLMTSASVAANGTYSAGPLPPGTYTVTPVSSNYYFVPSSRSVTLGTANVTGIDFAVGDPLAGQTLFTTQTPAVTNASDAVNYEMATAFTAGVAGYVTGIRYWKAPSDTGVHIGKVWSSTGTLLASVTFSNETASGWQQQALSSLLPIAADMTYIVSVNTSNTFYVASSGELSSQVINGDLRSVVGNNGLFGSAGQFPTGSFGNTNYYRDIFFVPAPTSISLASVSVSPSNIAGGASTTGTVTLTGPALGGGAVVTLSDDSASAATPASVTVPEGAVGATFNITTSVVGSLTPVTITGTYNATRTTTLTIQAPSVTNVSLSPTSLVGGFSSTATVTISNPAPAGGVVVTLSSNNAAATVPPSVTVAAGTTTANFTVTTTGVATVTTASISGSAGFGTAQSATLTINPAVISTLVLSPSTVVGGLVSTATVTLTGAAPAGGAVVTLSSDNAAATVPASVTVAAGANSATFAVTTGTVAAPTAANISANYLGTQTAPLSIEIAVLSTFSLNPASIAGGNSGTGTLTLNGPAHTGGALVTLSSDNPSVSALEGVYSPAGLPGSTSIDWVSLDEPYSLMSSGVVVPVTGQPGLNMTLTTATGLPMQLLTNCATGQNCGWWGNFAPGSSVLWMSGNYATTTGWWDGNGPLTVTFSSPQRGLGMQIMADESGPFVATLCAYNGADTLLGCVPFNGNASGAADNSAVFVGLYDDVQEIAKVTIDNNGPLYPHDFAIGPMFVTSTRRQMVPVSVTIPAGAISADFPVNTSAVSSLTTVNLTANYVTTRNATLTVNPAVLSTITLNPSAVIGGASLIGTATLDGAAPAGGAIVTLAADNPVASSLQPVTTVTGMPQDGSINWFDLGPNFSLLASGSNVPVPGVSGLTMTVATGTGGPFQILTHCPGQVSCGWDGSFAPGAPLLWVNGIYDGFTGSWTPNGPMTFTLSAPQRGVAFQIMGDEFGPFTATLCAYDSSDVLLGCAPFAGNGTPYADASLPYIGLYNDAQQIKKITIDGGGALYPHDFAVSRVFVAQSRRMVPPTVKIQAGATSVTFPVNTETVNAATNVTVTGNYQIARTGALTVTPPAPASLSVSPLSVQGGTSATGTVTLVTPAPSGGAVIALSSNTGAAVVPATVTVAAGTTTANFVIGTNPVGVSTDATISATNGALTQTAILTVAPPSIAAVSMNPATIEGGAVSTATVTLTGPAPAGGSVVTLSDDSPSATTPASVTVAAGATTATFNVATTPVAVVTTVNITATYFGAQSAALTLNPATLTSVAMNPAAVTGGTSSTGTVLLSSAAPVGGWLITLSDDSASATTPASVTVPAGATSATFTVTTVPVAVTTPVVVSATLNGVTQTGSLTINPPTILSLAMNPSTMAGGNSSTGTATLNGAAPPAGVVVTLSDDSSLATTPASVTVAAGATSATFTVTTTGVLTTTTVTITSSFNGVQTATLTLTPPALASVVASPNSVKGGTPSTGTVTLDAIAPAGGLTVTLSSNHASATVPPSVTIAGGALSANFVITTTPVAGPTAATISATYAGVTRTSTLLLSAGITVDAIAFGDRNPKATSVTTAAFSTATANEVLLAFVAADLPFTGGGNNTVTSITGAGLTWTLVQRTNVQNGTAEIWRAVALTPLTNVTVTANLSISAVSSITVMSFQGVNTSGTNGSGAIGATVSANANPGAPTASLTTTANNSLVVGVGNDWDGAIARTIGPNQTMVHEFVVTNIGTFWTQRQSATTPSAGTVVTINDTAPTTDRFNLTICEILPAP